MKEKCGILYIAHERKLGGASLSLVVLAEEMQKRNYKVAVVVPFYFSPLAKELRRRNIKTYWVFNGWWMQPVDWPGYMKLIFKIIYKLENISAYIIAFIAKRNGYQIIHSNSSVIDVGSKAAQIMNGKHVWHFREFGDLDYNLEFINGRKKSIEFLENRNDRLIFISESLLRHYDELKQNTRAHVIYNGIDESYLNFHEHNNKRIIFLISGNLTPNKRQDLVLKAVLELKRNGVKGFEVWIAGQAGSLQSAKEYANGLETFIKKHNLTEVKMLGRIINMNEIRRKADVEIVASTMEAFGRVTIEAMLSANPVIASDSGANPELITEGINGCLFESGNASALAEKMNMMIEDTIVIDEMGAYAYELAKEKFSASKNADLIERLYK